MGIGSGGFYVCKRDCSICLGDLNRGDSVAEWESPISPYAHSKCVELLESSESQLIRTINGLATKKIDQRLARLSAIGEVQTKCGEPSIKMFYEKHGKEAFEKLLNSEGVKAAKEWLKMHAKL